VRSPAAVLERRRVRCLHIAAVALQVACNAYDPSLSSGGEHRDGEGGSSPGAAGGSIRPPNGASAGGAGGAGPNDDAARGGGGNGTVSDGSPGADVATVFDGPSDGGTGVGPGDARSEGPPANDAPPIGDTDGAIVTESMIDDMEDPDDAILVADLRRGAWFVLNDGTAGAVQTPAMGAVFTMTAIPGGRGTSTYAAHTAGQGFTVWSALFGFWLNRRPAQLKELYDASKYNAITFWARAGVSDAAGFSPSVRIQLPDRNTDPDGQICTADGSAGCSDHFGRNIVLTSDWVKYIIRFTSMQQAGFGFIAPNLDAAHLYGVEFQFPLGSAFDCWVDDIAFATVP
jgi:hypothetical protein